MNFLRKCIALLTVAVLMVTFSAPAAVSAEAVEAVTAPAPKSSLFYFGRSVMEQMYNGEALCYAYDRLVEGLSAQQPTIDISHPTYKINANEASLVYDAVKGDHPDFFWVNGVSITTLHRVAQSFLPIYDTVTLAYKEAIELRVNELTADLDGKSDYEKSLILHNRLCELVTYGFSEHHQTIVGSLILGESVCAGYAHGYQILLQEVGIPCFYVTGTSRGVAHAWNLVRLDGEWYYTDVTWDDQTADGEIFYAYFNETYEQISEDHTPDQFADYLPRTTATAHNYYVRNGLVVDASQPIDINKVAQAIVFSYPSRLFIIGDPHVFMDNLIPRLGEVVKTIASDCTAYSLKVGLLGHELILHLDIAHPHTYTTVTTNATCGTAGSIDTRCSVCGHTTTEIIEPLGHNMVSHAAKAPTCTEDGWEAYEACTRCDYSTQETISAIGHEVAETWWQDDAQHGHLCNHCGDRMEAADHVYDDDKDADCNVCAYEREVAPLLLGDLDGNGKVNNRDLGLLQQYLNEWEITVDTDAADMNGDGRLNNRDMGLLQLQLNE